MRIGLFAETLIGIKARHPDFLLNGETLANDSPLFREILTGFFGVMFAVVFILTSLLLG